MTVLTHSSSRLKTLIVGGGGFIGSRLAHHLARQADREVIIAGRSSAPRFPLPDGVSYVQGDVGNLAFISNLLENCDEVVDLAYATVPKTSFDDPVHDVLVNLPSSVVLLGQASKCKLRRLVLVSSGGTVYGNAAYLPIDEMHPTNPVSPYGITKLALEKYALMFHRLEELPVVIVRPGNPYGPNQFGNLGQGFIGTALYSILQRQPVHVFGERGTVRDYIYVEDLVAGLSAALHHGNVGEIYNIGTGIGHDNRSILDELDLVVRADGYSVECEHRPFRAFDVAENVLSSARLTYLSGWRPQVDLHAGLETTWRWAKEQGFLA